MLPYASYLRVYEPIGGSRERSSSAAADDLEWLSRAGVTVAAEQRRALEQLLKPAAWSSDSELAGAYVLHRDSQALLCPVDLPARAFVALVEGDDGSGVGLRALLAASDSELAQLTGAAHDRWQARGHRRRPQIRQATWGVPRTWFTLVVEDEREVYELEGVTSVRYRSRLTDARRRLTAAARVLGRLLDDDDVLAELRSLQTWLQEYDEAGWVELDYAGVATLLGEALATDVSARDIHQAVEGLRRRDFAAAAAAYRRFEERWRPVNAYERAN